MSKLLGVYINDVNTNENVININVEISCRINAIKLLVSLNDYGHSICKVIWDYCTKFIRLIDLKKFIELDEIKVKIYLTPIDQLCNTDVIEQLIFFLFFFN